jgi:RES domain-containing protein
MLYCNRDVSLAIDDMLASQNSYGAGGTSYGVFSNSEEMALNLGFAGFRRASYDFYKSDWKYLNDATLRGQAAFRDDIRGVLIPAGTSTVYDDVVGRSMRRPFLHVRYRASEIDDRRMKTWITGSVGGNITSHLDAMEINFLSERCLVVQGANNFMLLN